MFGGRDPPGTAGGDYALPTRPIWIKGVGTTQEGGKAGGRHGSEENNLKTGEEGEKRGKGGKKGEERGQRKVEV